MKINWILLGLLSGPLSVSVGLAAEKPSQGIRKIKDVVIYSDARFHCAFPSVEQRPDGELLVAFRRAPERRLLGEKRTFHTDANSQLVLVRSADEGETWTNAPQLLYAHAFGGSQDPGLLQLRNGTLLCSSYGWAWLRPEGVAQLKPPVIKAHLDGFTFLGGYLLRSADGGRTWQGPIYPPHVLPETGLDPYGVPLPAFNRGAMIEGKSGRIFWVVAAHESIAPRKVSTQLLASDDKGLTWTHLGVVARDEKASFTETSIYETPRGELVAFMRTENLDDAACLTRSTDGGRTFQPWRSMGFQGHPLQAMRLPDNRVLLVYGYRHKPFGIRARVLNPECTDFTAAPEVVLRDDGGSVDLGYPWATMIAKDRALVVYYFNRADGPRTIEGTVVQLE
ncbi:MAG: sialidase family protein [Opitutaceae bacterium]